MAVTDQWYKVEGTYAGETIYALVSDMTPEAISEAVGLLLQGFANISSIDTSTGEIEMALKITPYDGNFEFEKEMVCPSNA